MCVCVGVCGWVGGCGLNTDNLSQLFQIIFSLLQCTWSIQFLVESLSTVVLGYIYRRQKRI